MKLIEENQKPYFTKIKHKIKACKVKYTNAIKLVEELKEIPEEGEALYIWIQGNFIFGDFLIQYITENNIDVEELTIITLSLAENNIEALSELINQKWVEKINLLISGYFVRTEKTKHTNTHNALITANKNSNFKVYVSNTHQKITLIKLKSGQKIVIHGSANMKGSQNYEQIMIENNNYLYDFNYEYFNNLILKQNGNVW
jgi:hypothetical protein